jgi:hypothetical protein
MEYRTCPVVLTDTNTFLENFGNVKTVGVFNVLRVLLTRAMEGNFVECFTAGEDQACSDSVFWLLWNEADHLRYRFEILGYSSYLRADT